jgi:hypothetical protein
MGAGGRRKKRDPRGGIKHQPGRGHDRKSAPIKKRRFERKADRKRRAAEEAARKQWEEWDKIPEETKKLLGEKAAPKVPRPKDED